MPARTFIHDLQPAQLVEGIYAIHNCQLGQTKAGKPYIKCLIADRSGKTPGRMWNASEQLFRTLPTDGFVHLEGQTQPYQGQMQIIIHQIAAANPSRDDLHQLLPCTQFDVDQMFTEVCDRLEALTHPSLRALAKQFLDDLPLMDRFRQAPAAMTVHHAFLGGLLEHTLSLLRLADVFCPLYPQLNRDMVVFGLFIHDLGKCQELTWEHGFAYSDDGQLVGHIAQGILWLQRKAEDSAAQGQPVSPAILRVLQHMILSHHGRPEFGALKIPSTPEAIAVSMLDNLDAKLHIALAASRMDDPAKTVEQGGNFTEKIWSLETRIYRPDPTTINDS